VTNEDPYYRRLLLLRELRQHLSTDADLRDFYGAPSRNVEWSINRVYEEIRDLEASAIDFSRVWYAQPPLPMSQPDQSGSSRACETGYGQRFR
jgi:hypothetical protein